MKIWKHGIFIGILTIFVIVFVSGCSNDSLNGTWEDNSGRIFVISGKDVSLIDGNFKSKGSYSINENGDISINVPGLSGYGGYFIRIDKNTRKIGTMWGPMTWTRKK